MSGKSISEHEPYTPFFHRLDQDPVMEEGGVFMKIVVLKLPKMLCGFARRLFHMD